MDKKIDPINKKYFIPLEQSEKWFSGLFYVTGVLSIATLFVSEQNVKDTLLIIFSISTFVMFVLSAGIRLYFYPRAQIKRQCDFLEHAYSSVRSPENTKNYYNNNAKTVYRRLVSQLLENLFYSKNTGAEMVKRFRIQVSIYFIVWLAVIIYRGTDYNLILILSQLIFSEQIISYWFRLEKLQHNCENLYELVYKHAVSSQESARDVHELLIKYETVKANTGITYKSAIFETGETSLDKDWKTIKNAILTE